MIIAAKQNFNSSNGGNLVLLDTNKLSNKFAEPILTSIQNKRCSIAVNIENAVEYYREQKIAQLQCPQLVEALVEIYID